MDDTMHYEAEEERGIRHVLVRKLDNEESEKVEIQIFHGTRKKTVNEIKKELLKKTQQKVDPMKVDLEGVMQETVLMKDDENITNYDKFLNYKKAHLQFKNRDGLSL
nr:hypothetical protein BgiMline_019970 [Biomphalaria glabrata]